MVVASAAACLVACAPTSGPEVSAAQRRAIGDTLTRLIASAYDFSKPDVVGRLMSLYPERGPVVSASAGHVTTSRDTLEWQIRQFWEYVGRNMRDPKWTWGERRIEVLSPDAAVMTWTYTIPHRTPAGMPHVIGGAWTALFERRDGRWVIVQEHLSDAPQQMGTQTGAAMGPM
jgi:ketosteroid isomerase-like protein